MRIVTPMLAACIAAGPAFVTPARAAPTELSTSEVVRIRRFVLLVGANDGGRDRTPLRFAGSDAGNVAVVMDELGGVSPSDRMVLLDPSPDRVRATFDRIRRDVARAKAAGERVQFMFYYSGHSDERGLLLAGVVLSYRELRQRIDAIPADVRLGVLDSCASGAFTQVKGGSRQAPFLLDGATVEGHAYLTSSSADEAAQESERIRASFFTHFFVTGLRGAADVNRDKLVTLNEAYRFAFDETLARTETTSGGAQHPAYDIRLTGTGDLVMTDLRRTSAKLEIAAALGGRLYVRDARGNLTAELYKPAGSGPVILALEPGVYRVTIDDGRALHRADVLVGTRTPTSVTPSAFERVRREQTHVRGRELPAGHARIPVDFGIVPIASVNRIAQGKAVVNNFGISVGVGRNARTHGLYFALAGAVSQYGVVGAQLSLGTAITREVVGLQSAAMAGISTGEVRGVQWNGAVSYSGDVDGAQIGVVNVTRGKVRGVQIGLVNWADQADVSIGLLPLTRKGGVAGEVWSSDTAAVNLGIRLRARRTYVLFAAGVHPFGRGFGGQLGAGLGGRIPVGERIFVDVDVLASAVFPRFRFADTYLLAQLRAMFGGRVYDRIELWAGVTGNMLNDWTRAVDTRPGYQWTTYRWQSAAGDFRLALWPGFAAGLRL